MKDTLHSSPDIKFDHLLSLSGPYGTFEHAEYATARVEHGYCTDDVARALLVSVREPHPPSAVQDLARSSIQFLADAQVPSGEFYNRRLPTGEWAGVPTRDDCWGRALWALGTTVSSSPDEALVEEALRRFDVAAQDVSSDKHAIAFAVLGASEVLSVIPSHPAARRLILTGALALSSQEHGRTWYWGEKRLSYANAALAEALLVSGEILDDDILVQRALRQLRWLLELETPRGHLSVTSAVGRKRGAAPQMFDQQPIEVAAMNEACVRALKVTRNPVWRKGHELCVQWFLGNNDKGALMYDPATGGGYDGLTANGPNLNQGAESTIALLTTLQHARSLNTT